MSRTIDERVVDMQFNNKQFEAGVKETVGSVEKLKKTLNFDESAKSLSGLNATANKFNLSNIAAGVETIASRFTTLGIIGMTALQNIANSAFLAGKQVLESLTITPITQGFSEYELKMGSIQTIMAGTGESLATVNKYLEDLNRYSDQTIYSFADMTSNIGKFTNAGVSLKDAVAAIQGIANVAAVSGANANEAARAMYNFSQALSSGSVKLMDWKSIELANMATKEFKQELINAAVAAGTLKKTAKGTYKTLGGTVVSATKGFNESLEKQWLTTKVLTETLKKYTDTSTDLGKKATAAATEVKTLTQLLDTMKESVGSGWAQTWELLVGNFSEAKSLFTSMNNVFGELIQSSSDARNNLIKGWKDLGGRQAVVDSLSNAFQALIAIMKPIKEAFTEVFPPATATQLYKITDAIRNFTKNLIISDDQAKQIKEVFIGIFSSFKIGGGFISFLVGKVKELVKSIPPMKTNLLTVAASVGTWLTKLEETITKTDAFNTAFETIAKKIQQAKDAIKPTIQAIIDWFEQLKVNALPTLSGILEKIKTGFQNIVNFFISLKTSISNGISGIKEAMPQLSGVGTKIAEVFSKIGESGGSLENIDFGKIQDILTGGLIAALGTALTKLIWSFSRVPDEISGVVKEVKGTVEQFTEILEGVKGCLEAYQNDLKADIIKKIAISIGILAASIFVLSLIDTVQLTAAILAITALFGALVGSIAVLQKTMSTTGGMERAALGLITLSVSILVLAVALKKISEIDSEALGRGLLGLGIALTIFGTTVKRISSYSGDLIQGSVAMIGMALAIVVLSSAVKKLGELDQKVVMQGLLAMTVVLTELALFTKVAGSPEKLMASATALQGLALAIGILSLSILVLSTIEPSALSNALLAMSVSLGALTLAMNAMPTDMAQRTTGLIGTAIAITILAGAIKLMSTMSWDEVLRGLGTMAGALAILVVAMNSLPQALPGAAALLVMSAAMLIMAGVLTIFGNMDIKAIAIGLGVLAAVFVVLGLAGLILAPIAPVILTLAAAVALLGIGLLGVGVGMLAFATGLAALAAAFYANGQVIVQAIKALVDLIPYVADALGKGVVAFAKAITDGMPYIIEAIRAYFAGIITVLDELIPPVIEAVLKFIDTLLLKLVEYVPRFVDSAMKIIAGFLKGIADNISAVVQAGIDLIMNFIDGITKKIPLILDTTTELILTFLNGIANTVRTKHKDFEDAAVNIMTALGDAFASAMTRAVTVGEDIIRGMIKGVKNLAKSLANQAVNVVKGAVNAVRGFLEINSPSRVFMEIGEYSGEGMVIGLRNMAGKVANASENLGEGAVNAMSQALGRVADSLNSDVDLQPTIRPVIDMTDVESGLKSTFGKKQGITVEGTVKKVATIADGQNRQNGSSNDVTNTENTDNRRIVIENHYSVRNDNDIRKISKDQKKLVSRYSLAKGVPVLT